MTEQTRRNILRYGIAIDLVILATGVGMLVPATGPLLAGVFSAAVALSVWRGGWKGALTALLLSVAAMLGAFAEVVQAQHVAAMAGLGVAESAIVALIVRKRPSQTAEVAAPLAEPAVVREVDEPALAEVVPLPRKAALAPERRRDAAGPAAETAAVPGGEASRGAPATSPADAAATPPPLERQRDAAGPAAETAAVPEAEPLRRGAPATSPADAAATPPPLERQRAAAASAAEPAALRKAEKARRRAEQQAARIAAEAEAVRKRAEEQAAREREQAARIAAEAEAARKRAEEQAAREREQAARVAAEAEAARQAAEAEAARQRAQATRLAEEIAREREAAQRQLQERLETERRAVEEDLRRQLEAERAALRAQSERALAAERERLAREAQVAAAPAPAKPAPPRRPAPKFSLVDTVTSWFRREPQPNVVNLKNKRLPTNGAANNTATRRPQPASAAPAKRPAPVQKPKILFLERRRGTADTIVARLRQRNIEIEVVERWVDAVDEIFRFKPNALFLDVEHPDFERIHRTVMEKSSQMPIVLTGRSAVSAPAIRHAAFVARPYDVDEIAKLAQTAHASPEDLLAQQLMPRAAPAPKPVVAAPKAVEKPKPIPLSPMEPPRPAPAPQVAKSKDDYEVACFSCRATFNAVDADWCSCLAKERTLVCTNCLACFCKAPPAYKEKFWVEAPPRLFERKSAEARRPNGGLPANPPASEVLRPLVLTVEDDEEIQAIVQRVAANLGYGYIWATNGQDGLDLAREYKPNMILSDAFMPKLDGREMCRILKEEPIGADMKMVVMTGLYTDTKYRSEAVKRFHVDDYIAKPVAITDLINLLQKHLEGVTGLPAPEDLHELHRAQVLDEEPAPAEEDVPLSEILGGVPDTLPAHPVRHAKPEREQYDVCCFNCQNTFDATRAEWCSCVGRDNTLVCEQCGGCFCKAPAAYRERFWIDAPPSLFERKMIGSKRALNARSNPAPLEVKRPLILLVEDDENVQLIVRTVVSSMGFGFVVGANGQEGLSLAREYNPDLILSDAFMPKLDGREMCRLLKEDPTTSRSKAIIMTGLYTDRKYRNEALDYFKVDDYVAKPLAVDDLIKLFKKHLPQEVAAH